MSTILVINAGSSSLKYATFTPGPDGPVRDRSGSVDTGDTTLSAALASVVEQLGDNRPAAVGHRVVHGGTRFTGPAVVDAAAREALAELARFAPLHLPANLRGIDAATVAFPDALQVACFDTAFHQGHPWVADTYALPRDLHAAGVRRYGYHGLSYESIVAALRRLAPDLAAGRVVVAHLGNGASLCAIKDGRSVESTMGFSALDGVPMGTRCGQLDPGVLLYLMDERQMTVRQVAELLYRKSGLLGLSGVSSDMRDLLASDKPEVRQAVEYFVYRVRMAIASLAAALGGVDGIVFTGGIGEHAAPVRADVLRGLAWLGVDFDESTNSACLTRPSSKVAAWVIPTDEEGMIARNVINLLPKTG